MRTRPATEFFVPHTLTLERRQAVCDELMDIIPDRPGEVPAHRPSEDLIYESVVVRLLPELRLLPEVAPDLAIRPEVARFLGQHPVQHLFAESLSIAVLYRDIPEPEANYCADRLGVTPLFGHYLEGMAGLTPTVQDRLPL